MDSLAGHLLIASSGLLDPNFFRSVVLLVRHTEDGALGLIINRPTSVSIKEAWSRVSEEPCQREDHVRLGGPCPGPLMALHSQADLVEIEALPGVYFSAMPENVVQLVANTDSDVRFFSGYAGWGGEQLAQELEAGAWHTLPASSEHVFSTAHDLWQSLIRQVGRSMLASVLKLKHVPEDASLN